MAKNACTGLPSIAVRVTPRHLGRCIKPGRPHSSEVQTYVAFYSAQFNVVDTSTVGGVACVDRSIACPCTTEPHLHQHSTAADKAPPQQRHAPLGCVHADRSPLQLKLSWSVVWSFTRLFLRKKVRQMHRGTALKLYGGDRVQCVLF